MPLVKAGSLVSPISQKWLFHERAKIISPEHLDFPETMLSMTGDRSGRVVFLNFLFLKIKQGDESIFSL